MRTTYETVVHSAVLGPVLVLAGAIEGTACLCRAAVTVADLVTGASRERRRLGGSGFRTA